MTHHERELLRNIYYDAFCDACNPVSVLDESVAGALSAAQVRRAVDGLVAAGYLQWTAADDGATVVLTETALLELNAARTCECNGRGWRLPGSGEPIFSARHSFGLRGAAQNPMFHIIRILEYLDRQPRP